MRAVLAGILVLTLSSLTFAQARGLVLGIGFANHYRNDCWTPMLVQVTPETTQNLELEIRVTQKDLDGDQPAYVRRISLTGNVEGQRPRDQNFWMYFQPSPLGGGLPSRPDPLRDLQERLQVGLYTPGGKLIAPLPVTAMITDLNRLVPTRGTRLVLVVAESGASVLWQDYDPARTRGALEEVVFIPVRPDELPENVLGYGAVDVILWAGATPPDPSLATDAPRRLALEQYVKQGGHLVVLHSANWKQTAAALGDMLPVVVADSLDRTDLDHLRRLAYPNAQPDRQGRWPWEGPKEGWDPNNFVEKGQPVPFKAARAAAKPTAVVDAVMEWNGDSAQQTPFIARQRYGLGAVTWVGQDLSDPTLTRRAKSRWPMIWNRVFDWKDDLEYYDPAAPSPQLVAYDRAQGAWDLGAAALAGMEMQGKTGSYVFLAVVFFVLYWLAAGPGSYLFLANKKRTAMSWFVFAASALVAAGVTVLIVKLVLRGPPQLKHVTLVRTTPGEPALADSRMGLYIPQDGVKRVILKGTQAGRVSHIEPFAANPKYVPVDSGFTARLDYRVEVRDPTSAGEPTLDVPYRSTLKKLQAKWLGDAGGISAGGETVKVLPAGSKWLSGRLVNNTGRDLQSVYLAFKARSTRGDYEDRLVYLPKWEKGRSLDLQPDLMAQRASVVGDGGGIQARPGQGKIINDVIVHPSRQMGWEYYWSMPLRSGSIMEQQSKDLSDPAKQSFVMLSLFSRLPPMRNIPDERKPRSDLLRRGSRETDLSAALAAGSLVVLAEARDAGPLPLTMEVEGEPVAGEGVTFYQAVIPLDRSGETSASPAE